MNRSRVVLIIGVAVVLGLLASFFVYRQLSRAAALQRAQGNVQQVVVAATRLPLGTRLQPADLKYVSWPVESRVAGMFTDVKACVDRTLAITAEEDEPILEAKLAPSGSSGGLAGVIPQGMRAISLAVNDVIGVAGFAQPGTVVDVIVTGSPAGSPDKVTRTILENIRVLAAGQKIEPDKQGQPQVVPVITLEVTPEEADLLALASAQGRIQLALRNTVDGKKLRPPTVSEGALFGYAALPSKPATEGRNPNSNSAPPPGPYTIVIVRAGKREVASVPNP